MPCAGRSTWQRHSARPSRIITSASLTAGPSFTMTSSASTVPLDRAAQWGRTRMGHTLWVARRISSIAGSFGLRIRSRRPLNSCGTSVSSVRHQPGTPGICLRSSTWNRSAVPWYRCVPATKSATLPGHGVDLTRALSPGPYLQNSAGSPATPPAPPAPWAPPSSRSGRPQSPNSLSSSGRPVCAQRLALSLRLARYRVLRRPYQCAVSSGLRNTRSGSGSIQSFSITGRVGSACRTASKSRLANPS